MNKLNGNGLTLIELIVFIVIGAIILPASFVAFSSAIQHFSAPDYYVKARFYTEQKMEELTSNAYDCVCISRTPNSSGLCQMGSDRYDCNVGVDNDSPETGYTRTWDISYIDYTLAPSSNVGYKKITISITMPNSEVYDVSTIVTKRPKS